MAKAREKLLDEVTLKLETAGGKTVTPRPGMDPIEVAVYLIVATRHGDDAADRSLAALQSDFVDWNEVRVSSPREIGMSLKVKEAKAREARAREIREFLAYTFQTQCCVSLDFIHGIDFEEATASLSRFSGIDPGLGAQIVLYLNDSDDIQPSATLLRVARRLGLIDKRIPPTKARVALASYVGNGELHQFHRVLLHLGWTTCLAKTTRCLDCVAGEMCPSSKAEEEAERLAKKAAAAAKKAAAAAAAQKKREAAAKKKADAAAKKAEAAAKKKAAEQKKKIVALAKKKAAAAKKKLAAKKKAAAAAKKKAAASKKATSKKATSKKKAAGKTATRKKAAAKKTKTAGKSTKTKAAKASRPRSVSTKRAAKAKAKTKTKARPAAKKATKSKKAGSAGAASGRKKKR